MASAVLSREGGLRFPRPVMPPGLVGTSHVVISMGFLEGVPVLERGPEGFQFLGTGLMGESEASGEAGLVEEAVRETGGGIAVGVRGGSGSWTFGSEAPGALPEPFATARRLTPWRSGELQRRVESGEAAIVWEAWGEAGGRKVSRRVESVGAP